MLPSAGADSGGVGMDGTMAGMPDMTATGDLVGKMEDTAGFGVGRANDGARPAGNADLFPQQDEGGLEDDALSAGAPSPVKRTTFPSEMDSAPPPADRNEAYTMFKANQGSELNSQLLAKKAELKKLKTAAKAASDEVNNRKGEIDRLKIDIEEKKQQRLAEMTGVEGAEDVVDEEEFILMKQEKDAKRAYREGFTTLKEAKKQMEGVQREVSMLKKELLERFDRWHQAGISGVTVVEQAPVDPADQLDDGEMFDKMEIDRVMSQDPDSVAFFQAHKKMAASHNLNKAATMRKQKLKRNI